MGFHLGFLAFNLLKIIQPGAFWVDAAFEEAAEVFMVFSLVKFEVDFVADDTDRFDFTAAVGHDVTEAFAVAVEFLFGFFHDVVAAD